MDGIQWRPQFMGDLRHEDLDEVVGSFEFFVRIIAFHIGHAHEDDDPCDDEDYHELDHVGKSIGQVDGNLEWILIVQELDDDEIDEGYEGAPLPESFFFKDQVYDGKQQDKDDIQPQQPAEQYAIIDDRHALQVVEDHRSYPMSFVIIKTDDGSVEEEFKGKGYYEMRLPIEIITDQATDGQDGRGGYRTQPVYEDHPADIALIGESLCPDGKKSYSFHIPWYIKKSQLIVQKTED